MLVPDRPTVTHEATFEALGVAPDGTRWAVRGTERTIVEQPALPPARRDDHKGAWLAGAAVFVLTVAVALAAVFHVVVEAAQ